MRGKQKRGDVKFSPVLRPCGVPGVRVQQLAEAEHNQEETMSGRRRLGIVIFSPVLCPCGLAGVRVPFHVEGEHEQEVMMSARWREGTVTQRGVAVSNHH